MYNHMEILKQARIQAGLTQAQVAKDSGYTVAHVNRFENGARQSLCLYYYYVTFILNDIQKQMLIENIVLTLLLLEDKSTYERSVVNSLGYIREAMKHEN